MLWGRADLVLEIFTPKFENIFEAGFSRVKVCNIFASRKLQKHKILKNFPKPFGTKRKVVGGGRFSLVDFLPEVRK